MMDNVFVSKRNSPLKRCELVRFAELPFYKQVDEIIKPVYLLSNSKSSDSVEFYFTLSPHQCKTITDGERLINECIIENDVKIIIRFCLNLSNSEQRDNQPPDVRVVVNETAISIPANSNFKRPFRPLDITKECKVMPGTTNSVRITCTKLFFSNPSAIHCFSVVLMRKLSASDMLDKLKNKSVRPPEFTRLFIKRKLSNDSDTDISATSLMASLICPLGKTRLRFPSRSYRCNHLQCFDALSYLQMNDKKPAWICPLCNEPAEFESLIIDGLFNEILSQVTDSNDIEFFENGDWEPFVRMLEDSRMGKRDAINVKNIKREKETIVVDLTCDDDDDD